MLHIDLPNRPARPAAVRDQMRARKIATLKELSDIRATGFGGADGVAILGYPL
ncbi:hypothetical protein KHC28_15665 [Ancylobacter sonchi]|uniref:hypothetical protein n=1 Tax=Ancylobacter sonchi TaxID=1937790 RepID=UPI001BD46367|nr:hypothetical protein [Ancylobacter sonchi]MBS7535091.1 hypothetical protein [Ancylobacter sonchi]